MKNILTNPAIIALGVGVLTYVYLLYGRPKVIKRTKSGRKVEVKPNVSFTMPLIAATIAWVVVYCYQQFYNKSVTQPVQGAPDIDIDNINIMDNGFQGDDNLVADGIDVRPTNQNGGAGDLSQLRQRVGNGNAPQIPQGHPSHPSQIQSQMAQSNTGQTVPQIGQIAPQFQGAQRGGLGFPQQVQQFQQPQPHQFQQQVMPTHVSRTGINIPTNLSDSNLPDVFINTI